MISILVWFKLFEFSYKKGKTAFQWGNIPPYQAHEITLLKNAHSRTLFCVR